MEITVLNIEKLPFLKRVFMNERINLSLFIIALSIEFYYDVNILYMVLTAFFILSRDRKLYLVNSIFCA